MNENLLKLRIPIENWSDRELLEAVHDPKYSYDVALEILREIEKRSKEEKQDEF